MSRHSAGSADPATAAPLFAALGDATRLALLDRLGASGPQSITRLTAGSAVTRQAITKHLQILAEAGLVHDMRRGRERIWTLDAGGLEEARRSLDQIAQQWDAALGRLKSFVEEEPATDAQSGSCATSGLTGALTPSVTE
jgi:DNA-binding transcriptional ArsR family regulator